MSFTSICPLIFSLTYSAFRQRRSPELLFCIVMWLLSLWWGGKVGWQLFLKPECSYSREGIFPLPYLQTTVFFPATILSVHLISSEAGNQITFNYKVIKGHLKSCLSKPAPAQQERGALHTKKRWILSQKDVSTKRDQEYLFNWQSCCPLVKQNHHRTRGESFGACQNEQHIILCTLWLHEEHGGKKNIQELSQGRFIFPIIGSNPDSPCQIITHTFSQK